VFSSPNLVLSYLGGLQSEKHVPRLRNLSLPDLPSLSQKLIVSLFARSDPPFVIRSVLIEWGCPGLQMVDLSERENRAWGRDRGDRANFVRILGG